MISTDHLVNLGSEKTVYAQTGPHAGMLETFDSPSPQEHRGRGDFSTNGVTHTFKEFSSLCPKTGQPDTGEVIINITPDKRLVETKSLKLYFFAYRNEGMFMEAIANKVADDLFAAMEPFHLIVEFAFGARGGIVTEVRAVRCKPQGS